MPASQERIALVSGANRGLGLDTSRQLALQGIRVILTSRDTAKGEAALQILQAEGLPVEYQPLDVTDPQGVQRLADTIAARHGQLHILVNNAGVVPRLPGSGRCQCAHGRD